MLYNDDCNSINTTPIFHICRIQHFITVVRTEVGGFQYPCHSPIELIIWAATTVRAINSKWSRRQSIVVKLKLREPLSCYHYLSDSLSDGLSLKLLIQSIQKVLLETMVSDPADLVKCTWNQPCVYKR